MSEVPLYEVVPKRSHSDIQTYLAPLYIYSSVTLLSLRQEFFLAAIHCPLELPPLPFLLPILFRPSWVQGLGFRDWALGFGFQGLVLRAWGSGFRVEGIGFGFGVLGVRAEG